MTEPRDRAARILAAWWPPALAGRIHGEPGFSVTLDRKILGHLIEREIREAVDEVRDEHRKEDRG